MTKKKYENDIDCTFSLLFNNSSSKEVFNLGVGEDGMVFVVLDLDPDSVLNVTCAELVPLETLHLLCWVSLVSLGGGGC